MAFGWSTAGSVINAAAVQSGLATAANPYTSTDPNFILLVSLLETLGRDLWAEKQWTHLQREANFLTVTGTPTYALPGDFGGMINQTGWDRTNRLPLGGPLSPQEWQYLKALSVGTVFTVLFRPLQQTIHIYPDTSVPNAHSVAYEYVSRYWVRPSLTQNVTTAWSPSTAFALNQYVTHLGNIYICTQAGTSGSSGPAGIAPAADGGVDWDYVSTVGTEAPTAASDVVLFDSQLVIAGLRAEFLEKRGFDYAAAEDKYRARLAKAKGADTAAGVLRLNRRQGIPLLGERNVPLTGFGS